jgi:hypothetical protein
MRGQPKAHPRRLRLGGAEHSERWATEGAIREPQSHNFSVIPAQAGTESTVVVPGPVSWVPPSVWMTRGVITRPSLEIA